jgi:hypothetical protein
MGLDRYGWLHIIETLANYDVTKFDAVLDRNIYEILTHLSYMRDYHSEQAKRIKKQYTHV